MIKFPFDTISSFFSGIVDFCSAISPFLLDILGFFFLFLVYKYLVRLIKSTCSVAAADEKSSQKSSSSSDDDSMAGFLSSLTFFASC